MVKVALAGVGNCASMLVQTILLARDGNRVPLNTVTGLEEIGGIRVTDIEFVAAFDVSKAKVGKDLAQAVLEPPNLVGKLGELPETGALVHLGPLADSVAPHMTGDFQPHPGASGVGVEEVARTLEETGAEVLVNLLPVGSEKASRIYAEAAARAGVAFVNAIPVFIASGGDGYWDRLYRDAGQPLLGDDVKGQLGATTLHRTIARLFSLRNVRVRGMYQLNIGGNTDFKNMLVESRLHSKRISKTRAVTSTVQQDLGEGGVRIGPSDYVPFLGNTKVAYIYIEGESFAGYPVTVDVKLVVNDKSMCAAVLADAIRIAGLARRRGDSGALCKPSAYLFKHPPRQAPSEEEAYKWLLDYIGGGDPGCPGP